MQHTLIAHCSPWITYYLFAILFSFLLDVTVSICLTLFTITIHPHFICQTQREEELLPTTRGSQTDILYPLFFVAVVVIVVSRLSRLSTHLPCRLRQTRLVIRILSVGRRILAVTMVSWSCSCGLCAFPYRPRHVPELQRHQVVLLSVQAVAYVLPLLCRLRRRRPFGSYFVLSFVSAVRSWCPLLTLQMGLVGPGFVVRPSLPRRSSRGSLPVRGLATRWVRGRQSASPHSGTAEAPGPVRAGLLASLLPRALAPQLRRPLLANKARSIWRHSQWLAVFGTPAGLLEKDPQVFPINPPSSPVDSFHWVSPGLMVRRVQWCGRRQRVRIPRAVPCCVPSTAQPLLQPVHMHMAVRGWFPCFATYLSVWQQN